MVNGILIDFDKDVLVHKRQIYSLSNWLSEVGGFAKAIQYVLAILFPIVSMADLYDFLITRLYKSVNISDV